MAKIAQLPVFGHILVHAFALYMGGWVAKRFPTKTLEPSTVQRLRIFFAIRSTLPGAHLAPLSANLPPVIKVVQDLCSWSGRSQRNFTKSRTYIFWHSPGLVFTCAACQRVSTSGSKNEYRGGSNIMPGRYLLGTLHSTTPSHINRPLDSKLLPAVMLFLRLPF